MLHYTVNFNNMMLLAPQGDGSYITESDTGYWIKILKIWIFKHSLVQDHTNSKQTHRVSNLYAKIHKSVVQGVESVPTNA